MELETFKIEILPLREKIMNYSLAYIHDNTEVEDIVQEVFLKLWRLRDKLDEYDSAEALSIRITKNLIIDKSRSKREFERNSESLYLTSTSKNPVEQLEEIDMAHYVRKIIETLPSLQQTIIRMKDIEGYELSEIAEITGSQIEAIRMNLSRARKKVREKLLSERL